MSMINYASREINCKLVYYGPGLGGKTTNLEHIYGKVSPNTRGKMISLATETERTLFFDFLPVDLGTIRGFKTRFHLYTVPGQVYYNASRKLILKGVDGGERRVDAEPIRQHVGVRVRPDQDSVHPPVQQARPAERRADPRSPGVLEPGVAHRRRGAAESHPRPDARGREPDRASRQSVGRPRAVPRGRGGPR